MPPADADPTRGITWIVCGAPNNGRYNLRFGEEPVMAQDGLFVYVQRTEKVVFLSADPTAGGGRIQS
jgi:hypothetical protein